MAIIKCIDCEKEISDKYSKCIHCGCPIDSSVITEHFETKNWKEVKAEGGSFWEQLKTQIKDINEKQKNVINNKIEEKNKIKVKIEQNKKNGIACCPKCGSTNLSANKKGFGVGKAVIGASIIINPFGLVAGNINAKKVRVTCLNCGHQFWPGK